MLIEEINSQIKQALIDKDTIRKNAYKSVKNTANLIVLEQKVELTDEIVIQAAKKELKTLQQTIDSVEVGCPLYWDSVAQKELIETLVPAEMSDEELEQTVQAILMTLPAGSNFGMKMKACMNELKGKVDGKRIKEIVQKI